METESPFLCPNTVTIRRNPHRNARPTPSATAPQTQASPKKLQEIPSFPIDDILSIQIPQSNPSTTENLNVFLRIKPEKVVEQDYGLRTKNVWPKNPAKGKAKKEKIKKKKSNAACVTVNDPHSVTLSPPLVLQTSKRMKSEVYEGFSCVFSANSLQGEVYERMVSPLVEEFLAGKSGMLAALGPSGSGKTHTIFGTPKEPGMVMLALQRIFKRSTDSSSELPRFYLSMFEIYSERGKGEKMLDLSPDGTDLNMQQSSIKGLQEVIITDAAQAESLIACAMLKRSTAKTNSNSQSSRSQCIINIRCTGKNLDREGFVQENNSVLTVVDLAGAEREKKTGNQGARLLESNFINNTSMVFCLCLRSLLEHQKNPKKPLQKHFQNSLLTRYLREYLEGKKRMALILTVKSGEEDYLDTSYLLRQASPYMKIKFDNVEEVSNMVCNKRPLQTLSTIEQPKRMRVSGVETSLIEEKNIGKKDKLPEKEAKFDIKDCTPQNFDSINLARKEAQERNYQIMQNFAKALWSVLKQHNEKLKVAELEIENLKVNLSNEKTRNLELVKELMYLRSCCTCTKESSQENTSAKVYTKFESEIELERNKFSEVCETNEDAYSPREPMCNLSPIIYGSTAGQDQDLLPQINSDIQSPHLRTFECKTISQQYVSPLKGHEDLISQGRCSTLEVVNTSALSAENSNDPNDQNEPECKTLVQECLYQTSEIISRNHEDLDECDHTAESNPPNLDMADSVFSSSQSCVIVSDDASSSVELVQSQSGKESLHSSVSPKQVASTEGCNEVCLPHSEPSLDTMKKPLNMQKPKRRLLPASSILLRDMSIFDVDDEIEKPKGNRNRKKSEANNVGKRTQGNMSLLRLLKNNLNI
ncbi:kinesin-like protein KIN-6 isoform X3 [Mangifera indica]|uniref:kinesin-like protein KIN-6 isoform X3 n=1 Tax=Mangifera indica TaxID=29780 RepID=UPI001CFA4270|nr:kinesin-like protein KIN-6 isoform X3 [Mangifera indica]